MGHKGTGAGPLFELLGDQVLGKAFVLGVSRLDATIVGVENNGKLDSLNILAVDGILSN